MTKFYIIDGIDGEPLGCDCYGGCWGDHSREWSYLAFENEEATQEAYRLVHQELDRTPRRSRNYGSYVWDSKDRLRFCTKELAKQHAERLVSLLNYTCETLELEAKALNTEDKLKAVQNLIVDASFTDGSHHKNWYLDQMLRIITGDDYAVFVSRFEDWDTGIAS